MYNRTSLDNDHTAIKDIHSKLAFYSDLRRSHINKTIRNIVNSAVGPAVSRGRGRASGDNV